MACYCGQSQRGVNYVGSPGSTDGQSGPATSHSMARTDGLSSIHGGNDKSISMRARASRASIPSTVTLKETPHGR